MRKLVHLMFNEYRWFRPVHFGRARMVGSLDAADEDYSALLTYFEEFQNITITAHTDRDYVMVFPAKNAALPFAGKLIWGTSITEAKKPGWQGAHLYQVAEVMKLLDSPLAQTGMDDDKDRKTLRLIPSPDGFGSIETFTVRDPSEGLAGLFWRNFFGPPFVHMFGARLQSLPAGTHQELGGGRLLVQPYALPTQAMTQEGDAAEQRLITVLGSECFYDHSRHQKPTRLPELSLPTP